MYWVTLLFVGGPVLAFTVNGTPISQGSKTAFVHPSTGKAVMREGTSTKANVAWKTWRRLVLEAASVTACESGWLMPEGPVEVNLIFWLTKPPTVRRDYPHVKPDVDKLARACLDSMTGIAYQDDARVVDLHVKKRYAETQPPGVSVTVRAV